MSSDLTLRPALAKLVREPARATPMQLWQALSPVERTLAVTAALTERRELRGALVAALAKQMRFRPQVLSGWEPSKLASYASRLPLGEAGLAVDLLIALHLHHRRPLLEAFLDAAGVPHEDGSIAVTLAAGDVEEGRMREAATSLLESGFPADEVVTYLLAQVVLDPAAWSPLGGWLRDTFAPDA